MSGKKADEVEHYTLGPMDLGGDISILQAQIHAWAVRKGWWEEGARKTFTECCMLMVTELAEAVEEFRNGHPSELVYFVQDADGNEKPEGIPIELADVFIRLADTCEAFGVNLPEAIAIKQAYNEKRSHRHGGKLI